jgi:hypothetical protein
MLSRITQVPSLLNLMLPTSPEPSDSYKPDNFEPPRIKHPLKMSITKNIINEVKKGIFFTKTSFGLSVNVTVFDKKSPPFYGGKLNHSG